MVASDAFVGLTFNQSIPGTVGLRIWVASEYTGVCQPINSSELILNGSFRRSFLKDQSSLRSCEIVDISSQ